MHVAMIIQGYYPRIGGAERQVGALAPRLAARGVRVSVLTRRYPGLSPFEMVDGIPVHRLPIPGPVPTAALVFTTAAMPLLWRLQPDILHAHELFSPATTALSGKRFFGTPIIATAHRSGPLGDLERMKNRPFGMRRLNAIKEQVDLFTTISNEVDQELAAFGIEAARRKNIPNGVDIARFQPVDTATKQRLRTKHKLAAGPLIVFAGRLAPEKRVDQLLNIWPAIRAKHPDAQLLILGTGPEESALKAQASAGVSFGGGVDDVAPYLQAADIWVLPSMAEGFSVAMLEAMATGLAVVITDVGGARDAIEDGVHGLIVPPDQPEQLQHALENVLAHPELRQQLGTAARQRVSAEYSLDAIADRLVEAYTQVAGRNT